MQNQKSSPLIILVLCCSIYVLSFFHRISPSILGGDIMATMNFSSSQFGMVGGITMAAYGLMQLPSGILTDTIGAKKLLTILVSLCGLSVIWFSQSASMSSMLMARFLVGIGAAITVPAMVLLAAYFPPQAYARATSILIASSGLATFFAASPLAFSCEVFGWRLSVLFSGVITCLLAILVWFVIKTPTAKVEYTAPASIKDIWKSVIQVFKTKQFWPVALWLMLLPGLYFIFGGLWWGPYLIEGNGLSQVEAGYVLTVGAIAIMVLQPMVGIFSDKYSRRKIFFIISPIFTLSSCLMMLFFTGKMSIELLMLQGLLFILGTNSAPLAFVVIRESFSPIMIGTAIGCMNMLTPIWSALMQNLYGTMLDWRLTSTGSKSDAFAETSVIYIVCCIMAFIVSLFIKESYGAEPS